MSQTDDLTGKFLIKNNSCNVQEKNEQLLCSTSGRLVTIVMFVFGMLLIYTSIIVIGWDLPKGRIHSSSLISGAAIFLTGIFFQWRCMRRQKEMGTYEINKETRTFLKVGMETGMTFDSVSRLRLSVNILGILIPGVFPRFPFWLFVHFKNGRKIRIAMAEKPAIMLVLAWLKEAGVPEVDWI